MAGLCIRYGDRPNVGLMEFACDYESEVADLPTMTEKGKGVFADYKQYAPLGSTCLVGNGMDGELLVYMLFSFGWKKL